MKRVAPVVVIHGAGGQLARVFDSARQLTEIEVDEAFDRPDVRAAGEELVDTIRRRLRARHRPASPGTPS